MRIAHLSEERMLAHQGRVTAFDVDAASQASLREALPGWHLHVVYGATVGSLRCNWDPAAVDLLVLGVRDDVTETLGLCRFFAFWTAWVKDSHLEEGQGAGANWALQAPVRRAEAPLVVLVPTGQKTLAGAALEAGAKSCLMLPIHPSEVVGTLAQVGTGNRPGRRTVGR